MLRGISATIALAIVAALLMLLGSEISSPLGQETVLEGTLSQEQDFVAAGIPEQLDAVLELAEINNKNTGITSVAASAVSKAQADSAAAASAQDAQVAADKAAKKSAKADKLTAKAEEAKAELAKANAELQSANSQMQKFTAAPVPLPSPGSSPPPPASPSAPAKPAAKAPAKPAAKAPAKPKPKGAAKPAAKAAGKPAAKKATISLKPGAKAKPVPQVRDLNGFKPTHFPLANSGVAPPADGGPPPPPKPRCFCLPPKSCFCRHPPAKEERHEWVKKEKKVLKEHPIPANATGSAAGSAPRVPHHVVAEQHIVKIAHRIKRLGPKHAAKMKKKMEAVSAIADNKTRAEVATQIAAEAKLAAERADAVKNRAGMAGVNLKPKQATASPFTVQMLSVAKKDITTTIEQIKSDKAAAKKKRQVKQKKLAAEQQKQATKKVIKFSFSDLGFKDVDDTPQNQENEPIVIQKADADKFPAEMMAVHPPAVHDVVVKAKLPADKPHDQKMSKRAPETHEPKKALSPFAKHMLDLAKKKSKSGTVSRQPHRETSTPTQTPKRPTLGESMEKAHAKMEAEDPPKAVHQDPPFENRVVDAAPQPDQQSEDEEPHEEWDKAEREGAKDSLNEVDQAEGSAPASHSVKEVQVKVKRVYRHMHKPAPHMNPQPSSDAIVHAKAKSSEIQSKIAHVQQNLLAHQKVKPASQPVSMAATEMHHAPAGVHSSVGAPGDVSAKGVASNQQHVKHVAAAAKQVVDHSAAIMEDKQTAKAQDQEEQRDVNAPREVTKATSSMLAVATEAPGNLMDLAKQLASAPSEGTLEHLIKHAPERAMHDTPKQADLNRDQEQAHEQLESEPEQTTAASGGLTAKQEQEMQELSHQQWRAHPAQLKTKPEPQPATQKKPAMHMQGDVTEQQESAYEEMEVASEKKAEAKREAKRKIEAAANQKAEAKEEAKREKQIGSKSFADLGFSDVNDSRDEEAKNTGNMQVQAKPEAVMPMQGDVNADQQREYEQLETKQSSVHTAPTVSRHREAQHAAIATLHEKAFEQTFRKTVSRPTQKEKKKINVTSEHKQKLPRGKRVIDAVDKHFDAIENRIAAIAIPKIDLKAKVKQAVKHAVKHAAKEAMNLGGTGDKVGTRVKKATSKAGANKHATAAAGTMVKAMAEPDKKPHTIPADAAVTAAAADALLAPRKSLEHDEHHNTQEAAQWLNSLDQDVNYDRTYWSGDDEESAEDTMVEVEEPSSEAEDAQMSMAEKLAVASGDDLDKLISTLHV